MNTDLCKSFDNAMYFVKDSPTLSRALKTACKKTSPECDCTPIDPQTTADQQCGNCCGFARDNAPENLKNLVGSVCKSTVCKGAELFGADGSCPRNSVVIPAPILQLLRTMDTRIDDFRNCSMTEDGDCKVDTNSSLVFLTLIIACAALVLSIICFAMKK